MLGNGVLCDFLVLSGYCSFGDRLGNGVGIVFFFFCVLGCSFCWEM